MINKKTLHAIGEKEMDRKEFLKYSGLFLVGLVGLRGVTALLTLDEKQHPVLASSENARQGFGSGKYGAR